MKKTIIASAIAAVVSAPAFADVKISGAVQIEAGEIRTGSAAATSQYITRSDIKFSGSEDMGNGMKAGFNITQTVDDATASANTDRFVTVSGDFGQLKAGTFESYIESTIGASAANDAAHDVSNEISDGETGTQNQIEFSMSPMAGLSVGYQAGDTADTVFASYSNAGLTVRAAQNSGNGSTDVTAFSVEYKMDGLRARYVEIDNDSGVAPSWFGVDYTMGNNNIAISQIMDGADDNNMTVSLNHQLSKQTNVYIAHGSDDDASVNDETIVGIKHSF
jgi:predicted porin